LVYELLRMPREEKFSFCVLHFGSDALSCNSYVRGNDEFPTYMPFRDGGYVAMGGVDFFGRREEYVTGLVRALGCHIVDTGCSGTSVYK
jgi:hypothetical protein